jgi:uncharacterized protein (TIGR00288 family)
MRMRYSSALISSKRPIQRWIVFGSATFGLGLGLGWLLSRDLPRSLLAGTVTATGGTIALVLSDLASQRPIKAKKGIEEIAAFWDHENIRSSAVDLARPIAEYISSQGHPRIKKVYSNWQKEGKSGKQTLTTFGFEQVQVSMGKQNSVDIKLAVDCLTIAYDQPEIQHFILVSADKDYIPLVNALKSMQKRVTVLARSGKVSQHLQNSADAFVAIEDLTSQVIEPAPTKPAELEPALSFEEGIECLLSAIAAAQEANKPPVFPILEQLMRSIEPTYKGFKSLQKPDGTRFKKFAQFIEAVAERGYIYVVGEGVHQEAHLSENPPDANKDDSPLKRLEIQHWEIIFARLEEAFSATPKQNQLGVRYMAFLYYLRQAYKTNEIPCNTRVQKLLLNHLIEKGMIIQQPDQSFTAAENWQEQKAAFLSAWETEVTP